MATITAAPANAHAPSRRWRRDRTRAALKSAAASGTAMASAARRRYRRPALVIGSFGCGVASAWHTFGLGAGLLSLAAALFVLEGLSGDEPDDQDEQ